MIKRFLILCSLVSFTGGALMAQNEEQESNLKAAFIYNFIKYIDWDNDPGNNEFVISILGSSVIDKPIAEIAKTNFVNHRRITIKHFNKPSDIGPCNILFIPQNYSFSLESVLNRIDKGVLVISESPGFARQGSAFNFVVINDKLRFEANLTALYLAGLKVSSQLLKLAIIVN